MTYDYKQDFPIFQHTDVAYIDNAATAQRPQCVLDAVADFYRCHNANPLRGLYPLSVEATDIYEQARETVRDFIGARSAREIVFTRNTTESLNLVAYSYGLTHVKAGDEVLVSIMEHHSNLLPWQMVCRQTGAALPEGKLLLFGQVAYLVPQELPEIKGLRVLRAGLELGQTMKNRFEPAHAWALWLKGLENSVSLAADAPELGQYLSGNVLPSGLRGWTLVRVDGLSLGWAKGDGTQLKNHYPKALRRPV